VLTKAGQAKPSESGSHSQNIFPWKPRENYCPRKEIRLPEQNFYTIL